MKASARLLKSAIFIITAALTVAFLCSGSAYAHDNGDIIVQYKTGVKPAETQFLNAMFGVKKVAGAGAVNAEAVIIQDGSSLQKKLADLNDESAVEYAERNYKRQTQITTPNDTYYSGYQWNMPIIRANYAWDVTRGSNSTVVAIIDTGVSLTHPDLSSKIIAGYDFVDNDSNPMDEQGHGTHVAGIAAAITNNGTGVAGVNWNARIMPVRVLDENGSGWDSDIAEGIIWATDNGADVINMSLGGPTSYPYTLQTAVDYAYSHGVVVVAAVGNSPDGIPIYPAACDHVIGVAATNSSDQRASFSNYGTFVDIAAPGDTIASTYWSGGSNTYAQASGTSMATPHVAGLAALVSGLYPTLTPAQIEQQIKLSSVDLGTPGWDQYYGSGRIDALSALNNPDGVVSFTISTVANQTAGSSFSITATAKKADGTTATTFDKQATLSDITGTISPVTTGFFISGVWTGNVTVTGAGLDRITVTYVQATGNSNQFTVSPAALNRIAVTPTSATLSTGNTAVFIATGYDVYDNVIAGTPFNWTQTGGSVSPASGGQTVYTAGPTLGSGFQVTATSGAFSASATISIIPGPLDHITIQPSIPTLIARSPQAFTAQGYDVNENPLSGVAHTWSTSAGLIDSVTGAYTAPRKTGTYQVAVTGVKDSVTKTGVATVTVTTGPLDHLHIDGLAAVTTAKARTYTAIAHDIYNNTISPPSFDWVATGGAPVTYTGNPFTYTAGSTPGSQTLTATATVDGVTKSVDQQVGIIPEPYPATYPHSTNFKFIKGLYWVALERSPEGDPGGVNYWTSLVDYGLSRVTIAWLIGNSHESHQLVVRELYASILDNQGPPRPEDVEFWANQMDAGMSRRQLKAIFFGSPGYIGQYATTSELIDNLYYEVLGRDPEPGGRDYWASMVSSGAITTSQLAYYLTYSPEYAQNYVTGEYWRILGRTPDISGRDYWAFMMGQGVSEEYLTALLYGSQEFYEKF